MTCIYSLELIKTFKLSMATKVHISKKAASTTGTSAKLQEKDEIKLIDLLYALILPSGNDAAVALAEYLGSINENINPIVNFVKGMNDFAADLNLESTTFKNPHGLSIKPNYSTVYDVCKLASYALKNETFSSVVNSKIYSCVIESPNGDRKVS